MPSPSLQSLCDRRNPFERHNQTCGIDRPTEHRSVTIVPLAVHNAARSIDTITETCRLKLSISFTANGKFAANN